ncbi:MAG: exopolyphosphatase [Polyangiales bacterium]
MNVAAVDIGTNSVRLLVTDSRGRTLEREMRITRLGQGVDQLHRLQQDAIARTCAVLAEYGTLIARHQAGRVRATATSAARDADNSEAFFDAAERALGTRPELLPGEVEAELSFRGATADLDPALGPFLVIDLGGGSTEFVLGQREPEQLLSLDIGCVRMTERHLHDDPPTAAQLDACLTDVSARLLAAKRAVDVKRARCVVGLAGTVTALAALQLELGRYDPGRTHHCRLTREQVHALLLRLATCNVEARRAMLLEPKRAEVIVGGAVVLFAIMRELEIAELLVSETDILDGLAASLR